MANKIYNNKVASKRTLQTLNINSLLGVDYTSSMNNIADYHAYEMSNYLKINNSLQTRAGYEQIYHSEQQHGKINGLWKCNYKGKEIIIAQINNIFYKVDNLNNYVFNAENYKRIGEIDLGKEPYIKKSFGVFANDRLYVFGGKYIVIKITDDEEKALEKSYEHIDDLYYKVSLVFEDEDTYIPTTTINITDEEKTMLEINRETLDEPNMMTNWRYNTINSFCGYKLDDNGNQTPIYGKRFVLDANVIEPEENTEENTYLSPMEIVIDNVGVFKLKITYKDENKEFPQLSIIASDGETIIGHVGDLHNKYKYFINTNTIYFENEIENLNINNANITVKYKVASNDYKLIDNCTFGVMYGAGGNRNRLFVSGNPEYPNVDYHTSRRNVYSTTNDADLLDNQDLTYFSAFDYCEYGTTNTAVTGYQIMGDGSLLVLKEKSETEPSVFFRDSTYQTDNNTSFVTEAYPLRVGNIGEGSVKGLKGSIKNLNNDIVFVSPNGLFGISATVSAGMLASDYKYAYSRSRIINNKFVKDIRESTNIATCLYDNKYFVTIKKQDNSYKTYVADGRYRYASQDKVDNEYDYEWFILDNIPAEEYLIVNENLYFTNNEGLYLFDFNSRDENKFKDVKKTTCSDGEYTMDLHNFISDRESINEQLESLMINHENNTRVIFVGDNMYNFIDSVEIYNDSGTKFETIDKYGNLKTRLITYFQNDTELLICTADGSIQKTIYSTKIDNEEDFIFICYDKNGTQINLMQSETPFYIFKKLDLVEAKILKHQDYYFVDKYGLEIKLSSDLKYSKGKDDYIEINCVMMFDEPITSKYITKAFNNGQSLYNKILHSLTVVNDSEEFSFVNLGLSTKTLAKRFDDYYRSGTSGLDDTYLNIFNADLTSKTFASSFTKNYLLKYNFIQFEFFNNEGMNSVINNLMITYTIGFKTIGVK